ncbi:MAG: Na(+)/H(+) antiporter NhaA [Bacteroidia bacterium]|nr:MAG: Na(+)/H(+) antiporter NhaA [Bacteroidia bacterium]
MRQRLTNLFLEFTKSEKNSGLVLIICTIISLLIANSSFSNEYIHFWHQPLTFSFFNVTISYPLEHWINDGLMTIFFLMVGLEIERELYEGELHPIKNAILPIVAAIGGMIAPALLYSIINWNLPTIKGFGIPMATDIAFSLAVLSLVSNKVPFSLKVLLTALAIIDDLGSIFVIAFFYGKEIQWFYLFLSLAIFFVLLIMNRLKIYRLTPYLLLGLPMWYCMMQSGIHATLSGVLLAFALPFNYKGEKNPSIRLQEMLHIPVGFIILPIFTLANTSIPVKLEYIDNLLLPHAIGIGIGLFFGKPLGITLSILLVNKLKFVSLPENVGLYKILATGVVAGIGFTMSIFITHLAFNNEVMIQSSKLMILIGSFLSGITAYLMFLLSKVK